MEHLESTGKADDAAIKALGLSTKKELASNYGLDLTKIDDDLATKYRSFDYAKSTGASDDALRKTGILPDSDLSYNYICSC